MHVKRSHGHCDVKYVCSLLRLVFLMYIYMDMVIICCPTTVCFCNRFHQQYLCMLSGPTRYDILVCIIIPSSKMCELVFDEMQNALPLLEKLYGPLTLDHDPDFR